MEQKKEKKCFLEGYPNIKKVPFLNWFLIRKTDIQRLKESQKIDSKRWSNQFNEIMNLRKKLKRYEG